MPAALTFMKGNKNRLKKSTHFNRQNIRPEDWISQSEAARIRGVSAQAISRLVKKGRFKTLNIGGRILLSRAEANAYQPKGAGRPRTK